MTDTSDRVRELIDQFEAGRAFETFSHGERIAIAVVLDRADLISLEAGTLDEAHDRLGPEWMAAIRALKEERRGRR